MPTEVAPEPESLGRRAGRPLRGGRGWDSIRLLPTRRWDPMRLGRLIPAILLIAVIVAPLSPKSKESIEGTPYNQWSLELVKTIMTKSPWAQEWGTSTAFDTKSQAGSQAVEGQDEGRNSFVIRLMSALPLRQAYVRYLQIVNHYDTMTPEQRQQFDS